MKTKAERRQNDCARMRKFREQAKQMGINPRLYWLTVDQAAATEAFFAERGWSPKTPRSALAAEAAIAKRLGERQVVAPAKKKSITRKATPAAPIENGQTKLDLDV